jgi:branched-chain amino acid transport system substrate-binding protein
MRPVVIAALGSLLVDASACSSKTDGPPPPPANAIEIGSLVALTGDLAGTGKDNTDAANLAVEQINAAGGVLERPLKLLVEDDKTTEAGARAGYTNLVSRQVTAVIGPSSSAQGASIADLIAASRTLTLGRTSTSSILSTLADDDFFFRLAPSDVFQAKVLANLVREAKVERLCIVHRQDTYGAPLADALAAELGTSVRVTRSAYNPSTRDLSPVLAKCDPLRCSASDAGAPDGGSPDCSEDAKVGLVMATFLSDGAAILSKAPGWSAAKQRFFFTDGARDTELLNLGLLPEKLQDARGTIPSGPDPQSPEGDVLAAYRSAYSARYGAPAPPFSQNAFEAVYVTATAIELAGTTERTAVRDAVRKASVPSGVSVSAGQWQAIREAIAARKPIDYRGVTGEANFDRNGDIEPPYYYRVWRIDRGESLTEKIEKVTR